MSNLHKSTFNQLVEFLEIDLTAFGDQPYYFCNSSTYAGATPVQGLVAWDNRQWVPVPFVSSGWQDGGENLVRPSISIPDVNGQLYVTLRQYEFATGAPVTRYQALYQDVVSGNPYAAFSEARYLLNSASGNGRQLDIELATHVDFQIAKIPSFKMTREHYPGLGSQLLR
ncbi:hypothetical protein N6H05_19535 [Sphingobium sp. WTD-1]|uniref:hypothetical protein n=1 Tax=Sphingobium sp. WTD-1 TaxID=2979467 RepID=UPI0024DE4BF1|nr:hypothetical protein [Sphingobium sp. WTD-1]WIA55203.1 hypothetical protein N6H05_19535 [Sphingobium sp. WTD-1]